MNSDLPVSDIGTWSKKALDLIHIAFAPSISRDIAGSIRNGNFDRKVTESRTEINGSSSSYMSYSIVISSTEDGVLLTVSYVLG
jgi:hypothetical protein